MNKAVDPLGTSVPAKRGRKSLSEIQKLRNLTVNSGIPSGRGGRVRKAKIVFDPSDEQNKSKRKSTPLVSPEVEPMAKQLNRSTEFKRELWSRKSTEPISAKPIDKRRKTMGEFENGCIICSRSDVKKGRFVYCIDCSSRGHFTCLRNGKLITSAEEEPSWQCAACQTCGICYESSVINRLFKCATCMNSYHLHCQKNQLAHVKKKQFKCENCYELENMQMPPTRIEPPPVERSKTPNGFAGFSREDTTAKPVAVRHSKSLLIHNNESQAKTVLIAEGRTVKIPLKTPDPEKPNKHAEKAQDSPHSDEFDLKWHDVSDPDSTGTPVPVAKITPSDFDAKGTIKTHDSVPDVKHWDCDEIFTYFLGTTTAEYAHVFKEHEIDGDALLLINREDVLTKLNLKLGPALRLYSHILTLQYKNNNPILGWDED